MIEAVGAGGAASLEWGVKKKGSRFVVLIERL